MKSASKKEKSGKILNCRNKKYLTDKDLRDSLLEYGEYLNHIAENRERLTDNKHIREFMSLIKNMIPAPKTTLDYNYQMNAIEIEQIEKAKAVLNHEAREDTKIRIAFEEMDSFWNEIEKGVYDK